MTPDLDSLYKYFDEVKTRGFQWHTNDCFMFTNNAWKAMYGHGWADDWDNKYINDIGLYMKLPELQKEFGFDSVEEAVDSKLTRVGLPPPRGALVITDKISQTSLGVAFGISDGNKAAFLGKSGLRFIPIRFVTAAWVEECGTS